MFEIGRSKRAQQALLLTTSASSRPGVPVGMRSVRCSGGSTPTRSTTR